MATTNAEVCVGCQNNGISECFGHTRATHGLHAIIADSPEEFATACASVLSDPSLAARLSGAARQPVAAEYEHTNGVRIIRETFKACLREQPPNPPEPNGGAE